MIVTFYSYKGGVGRTLALANVAYLLATDSENPCRVLLWDFDLEAPGLQHVFRCHWGAKKQGFVDCVHRYLTRAELPRIEEYIHPTDVPGVDILPAGRVTAQYSEKLENINWRQVYGEFRGHDFIQEVRRQIVSLPGEDGRPRYDYVLVDARTGYSDVGGICALQLPDAVVLMFRLNDQNISGIAKVYETIRAFGDQPEGRAIQVLPVISPAWPFATIEACKPVEKAKAIFGDREVLTITFEAALTFGEKIIAREQDRYATDLRICHDYQRLSDTVRDANPDDPRTMWKRAEGLWWRDEYKAALELYLAIVHRGAGRQPCWERIADITSVLSRTGASEEVDGAARMIDGWIAAHPTDPDALAARAQLHECRREPEEALNDYDRAFREGFSRAPAILEAAELAYANHQFDRVIAWSDLAASVGPDVGLDPLYRVHALAALGRVAEARTELRKAEASGSRSAEDLVEASIAVGEFQEARQRLSTVAPDREAVALLLGAVLDALEGSVAAGTQTIEKMLSAGVYPADWGYEELRVLVDAAAERGQVSPEVAQEISSWFERLGKRPAHSSNTGSARLARRRIRRTRPQA